MIKTLFLFPPGARGDFLANILYGNVLTTTWDKLTIEEVGKQSQFKNSDKLHRLGECTTGTYQQITQEHFNNWYTWWIKIDNQDLWEVAWLNLVKRPDNADRNWSNLYARYCLTRDINKEYQQLQSKFNRITNYRDLWSLDYLTNLYSEIHNKLPDESAKNRMQHNILINLDLVNSNPFKQTDELHDSR